jgi:hypothetical protein
MLLEYCIKNQYYPHMETLTPSQWIAACARKLNERWRTVDTEQLEEVAMDIWQDARLRSMEPSEAAVVWLLPVATLQTEDTQTAGDGLSVAL